MRPLESWVRFTERECRMGGWAPGAGGGVGWRVSVLGAKVSVWDDDNALDMDGRDGPTAA